MYAEYPYSNLPIQSRPTHYHHHRLKNVSVSCCLSCERAFVRFYQSDFYCSTHCYNGRIPNDFKPTYRVDHNDIFLYRNVRTLRLCLERLLELKRLELSSIYSSEMVFGSERLSLISDKTDLLQSIAKLINLVDPFEKTCFINIGNPDSILLSRNNVVFKQFVGRANYVLLMNGFHDFVDWCDDYFCSLSREEIENLEIEMASEILRDESEDISNEDFKFDID